MSDISQPLLKVAQVQSGYGGVRRGSSVARASAADGHLPDGGLTKQTEEHEESYPEGGIRAWLSVFGSFCGLVCCFGLMNTIGTFQAYIIHDQLSSYSAADVGWIFGLYLFVSFSIGIQTGPLFDAKGPKLLMVVGSTCLVAMMFLLGVCKGQWQP